jgi:DNA polymerase III subunit gamma/tau
MRKLALKYRPQSLDGLVGQEKAKAALASYLQSGANQSLLLVGASGTGKTTAARIIAATKTCTALPAPCGTCGDCLGIFSGNGTYGYTEMDAPRFTEPVYAKEMADRILNPSMIHWTTFIDEVHALQGGSFDALLKAIEEPSANATFICATTELSKIRSTFRTRCLIIQFVPLRPAELYKLLSDVCAAEDIRCEPKALDMLSVAAQGSARAALNLLDQVADQGDVIANYVASILSFGEGDSLIAFLEAVVANDWDGQLKALDEWAAEPIEIAKMIRDGLLYLYNFEVAQSRSTDIVNPAFFKITPEQRQPIVAGFRSRAGRRAFGDYWSDLLDLSKVDPATLTDRPSLVIHALKFHRAVNPEELASVTVVPPPASAASTLPYRGRSTKHAAIAQRKRAAKSDRSLNQVQAESIYDMATFLPQEHGLLFNTRIMLDHARLGVNNETEASKLVSQLTHELSIRVRSWARGASAHWIYVHRLQDGGIMTDIIVHIPQDALVHIERWLAGRLQDLCGDLALVAGAWSIDAATPGRATGHDVNRFQRHWYLVRPIWGGLDPEIMDWDEKGRRVPLVDLLKVPTKARKPVGDLVSLRALGSSRSLGPVARSKAAAGRMGFLSAFADDAWACVARGWEFDEYRDRLTEKEQRRDAEERIRLEFPASMNRLEQDAGENALARLMRSWPQDPKGRARSWKGWWA